MIYKPKQLVKEYGILASSNPKLGIRVDLEMITMLSSSTAVAVSAELCQEKMTKWQLKLVVQKTQMKETNIKQSVRIIC
jgi:hypothetical protein